MCSPRGARGGVAGAPGVELRAQKPPAETDARRRVFRRGSTEKPTTKGEATMSVRRAIAGTALVASMVLVSYSWP